MSAFASSKVKRISAGIFASTVASLAVSASPAGCLAGMRSSLIRGHFNGPLICSRRDASFRLAGRTAASSYSIYDYRYRFPAAQVMHGGQRLVVFRGRDYIGQYQLPPPPFLTVKVKGTQVLLQDPDTRQAVRLDFSRKPPSRILAGGEIESFGP